MLVGELPTQFGKTYALRRYDKVDIRFEAMSWICWYVIVSTEGLSGPPPVVVANPGPPPPTAPLLYDVPGLYPPTLPPIDEESISEYGAVDLIESLLLLGAISCPLAYALDRLGAKISVGSGCM
jgi:hypothetical protein